MIQHHFGDRNGLLMAVVDAGVARLLESLSSADVSDLPLRERIEVVVDTAWSCYSSPTSMAAFEILRATRGGAGESSRRHLFEMNSAIGQLGRLITEDAANAGVAEVIWATLRGVVLAQMIVGTSKSTGSKSGAHSSRWSRTICAEHGVCCNDVMSSKRSRRLARRRRCDRTDQVPLSACAGHQTLGRLRQHTHRGCRRRLRDGRRWAKKHPLHQSRRPGRVHALAARAVRT